MGNNVKISLEAFGDSNLSATFSAEEIAGKNVNQVVDLLLAKTDLPQKDMETQAIIKEEVNASGGYLPQIGIKPADNTAMIYQDARLGDNASKYIQNMGNPDDEIRISVTGDHIVGTFY